MGKVAFVGLDTIGWPMAARLAERMPTQVWTRRPEVAEQHAAEHGSQAVTAEDLAEVDVLVTRPTTESGLYRGKDCQKIRGGTAPVEQISSRKKYW